MKRIILNADDFGYSPMFNKGILELINEGAIKSTSVLVDKITNNQKNQVQDLIKKFEKSNTGVGLHIFFQSEDFKSEIRKQYDKFLEIFTKEPSHIDLHKLDYVKNGYLEIQRFCIKENIPTVNLTSIGGTLLDGIKTTKSPAINGTDLNYEEIIRLIDNFEEDVCNLVFNPGYFDPESKSSLNKSREDDMEKLRKLSDLLENKGIEIISFRDL